MYLDFTKFYIIEDFGKKISYKQMFEVTKIYRHTNDTDDTIQV